MRLRTLGVFELVEGAEQGAVRILTAGKGLALLTYLAHLPGHRASRDTLIELLWSDVDPERGRRTLRQTVWSLRQRLGETALRPEGEDIVLTLPLQNDAAEFETEARTGRLEPAWQHYRGHFVPFFATPGGAAFEQWADGERSRLRALWHIIGETLAHEALTAGRVDRCLEVARQLRQDDPERLEPWALLIAGHLARGQRVQARIEAESAIVLLGRLDRVPDARLAQLIATAQSPDPDTGTGAAPRRIEPELVGRETPFAALLGAWHRAKGGDGRTVLVQSPAGVGKTRLLRDFGTRLFATGAEQVAVRARPADRDLPYSLIASLAETLGNRPGARAISPAAAATLVDLAPALSNWFPAAPPPLRTGDELLRVRTMALAELVEAVADEQPLAIVVDDLHWSDDQSRVILASLGDRLVEHPVLFVLATRPPGLGSAVSPTAQVIDLEPLSIPQLEELLVSIASGDTTLIAALAQALHAASAGVPLLVLAGLELLLDQQQLMMVDGRWACANLEALRHALSRGSILEQVLQALPASANRALLAMAIAGRPLASPVLDALLGTGDGAVLATMLEQRGLAVRVDGRWEVAHDRVAESAVARASAEQHTQVTRDLGHALLATAGTTPLALRDAGRLLAAVDDAATAAAFARWLTAMQRPALWRRPLVAAREFLGTTPTRISPERLARTATVGGRLRGAWPVGFAAARAGGLAGVILALVAGAQLFIGTPASWLGVTFPPTSNGFLFDTLTPGCGFRRDCGEVAFPVMVELRDDAGLPTSRGPRAVMVRVASTGGPVLGGDTVMSLRRGIARFDSLRLHGQGPVEVEVVADGLPAVRSRSLVVHAGGGIGPRLWLVSGTVVGQPVDSINRTVVVRPGQPLRGELRLRALTNWGRASVLLGAVGLWGDRRTNFMALAVLPSHGVGVQSISLEDPNRLGRRFVAPTRPGRYRLLFTFDAETEMRFIASSTNWMLSEPAWNDGNDMADLPEAVLARMDSTGWVDSTRRLVGANLDRPMARFEVPYPLAGTSLIIEVRP